MRNDSQSKGREWLGLCDPAKPENRAKYWAFLDHLNIHESDRGFAVLTMAIVDDILVAALRFHSEDRKKSKSDDGKKLKGLSPERQCVEVGILTEEMASNIETMRVIRRRAAHDLFMPNADFISFEQADILAECRALNLPWWSQRLAIHLRKHGKRFKGQSEGRVLFATASQDIAVAVQRWIRALQKERAKTLGVHEAQDAAAIAR